MKPLALFVFTAIVIYAGSCWMFPFARCRWRRCEGGRRYRSDQKVWRDCRWCKGAGRRLRIGRRIFNAIQRRRRAGTKVGQ